MNHLFPQDGDRRHHRGVALSLIADWDMRLSIAQSRGQGWPGAMNRAVIFRAHLFYAESKNFYAHIREWGPISLAPSTDGFWQ